VPPRGNFAAEEAILSDAMSRSDSGAATREAGLSPRARIVAERFARFRTPENGAFFDALAEHFRSLHDDPCLDMNFEYAATANDRGRALAERIEKHVHLPARRWRRPRVLDVGCAYGGPLVAFAERGARVTGIDVNERLLALAQVNLRERGLDAHLVRGDATAAHPSFRSAFDVVVANDVVEHVPRLEAFLRNLASWLTPRGAVYFEIPNGACPDYVLRDGHHRLFGITLLDFNDARDYYSRRVSYGEYDTYNYLDFDGYARVFETCGLSLTLLPETLEGVSEEGLRASLASLEAGREAGLESVPAEQRSRVAEKLDAYLDRVAAAPPGPNRLRDFGVGFWRALARRRP
jgi:2-polyprenyl-3-methyl-5-hydroxy-6-metoxy-1,4-benzoquinol methylase